MIIYERYVFVTLTKVTREQAQELYNAITKYNNFLFFYYKEVTAILAHTSQKLQYEMIQISGVGQYITILCEKLKASYPRSATLPIELLTRSYADQIVRDLFGDDFDGIGLI